MDHLRNPLSNMNVGTQILGLKQKFRTYELSSGLESFDAIFGGTIPCSSIVALEEKDSSENTELICKYSIAEGIFNKHKIFIADVNGRNFCHGNKGLLDKVPGLWKQNEKKEDFNERMPSSNESMKIAWRYNSMNTINSSMAKSYKLDIHNILSKEEVEKADITGYISETPTYEELWSKIKEQVINNDMIKNRKNVCRIIICGLGSYDDSKENLIKFLRLLFTYTRNFHSLIYLSFNSDVLMKHQRDALLDISSAFFSFNAYENTKGFFDKFDGRLIIKKLPTITSVIPFKPKSVDLIYEKHKRYLDIRIFHLPPALGADEDIGSKSSCGGNKRKFSTTNGCGGVEEQF
uniref:Elongator complex protein 4 n=1 Tax=Parastrongyloides trichosuri TaxID=131310 RepID=A0A0N4Z941_PARTI